MIINTVFKLKLLKNMELLSEFLNYNYKLIGELLNYNYKLIGELFN